jgi:hypothetical protein
MSSKKKASRDSVVASTCTEPEVTTAVDLCLPDGSLNPAACGWSRFPLHRSNLTWPPLRKKRWDYWCILSRRVVVSAVVADIDYATLAYVWILDRATGVETKAEMFLPLGLCCGGRISTLSDEPCRGSVRASSGKMSLCIDEQPRGTLLSAAVRGAVHELPHASVDLSIERPPHHETLSVVIPWSQHQFQYTSKHTARPVTGRVRVGTTTWELGGADGEDEACASVRECRGCTPAGTVQTSPSSARRLARAHATHNHWSRVFVSSPLCLLHPQGGSWTSAGACGRSR